MATIAFSEDSPRTPFARTPCADDDFSDGYLLDRFIRANDGSAFEELVRRHGRMVLGVCRRVLDNAHDAEDCFQAVFMVLVRKAASVQPRDMVGNWLYGVAYRTALEAKKLAARRRNREKKRCEMPRPESVETTSDWHDLKPLLDQELSKLPNKYREVLIACDLEGRTRKEVAKALSLAEGTVASRLARARVILAKRLSRRNLSIAPGLLAMLLTEHAVEDVPTTLTATTAQTATHLGAGRPINGDIGLLTDTVVRALSRTKAKIGGAIVVVLTLIGLAIGTLLPSALAERKALHPKLPHIGVKPDALNEKTEQTRDAVLEVIDPANRVISASVPTDGVGDSVIDLHVTPSTRITLEGREGRFADLRTGMCVHLEWHADAAGKRRAVRIDVTGEAVPGIVQAIDDDALTIRCESSKKGEFIDKKYDLDKDAKVFVNGKKSKLGDLKVKMRVTVQAPSGKTKAFGVKAAGPKVSGSVKSVHVDKRTLALDVPDLHLIAEGIVVAPDAVVTIATKRATLSDVQAGMSVTVQMSAEMEASYVVAISGLPGAKK